MQSKRSMSLNQYLYAKEKLGQAVRCLSILPGDVRSRLRFAFLEFHILTEDNFPPELKKDWRWIKKQLTRFGPIYNHKGDVAVGSVNNTMGRIKNSTGVKIAKKIYDLNIKLEDYINTIRPSNRF